MVFVDKAPLIRKIEELRGGSRVISYITSDRPGPVGARVAPDVIPLFSKQIKEEIAPDGRVSKIDLFLYSAGGDTLVPWRLVSMIREHCDQFSVLVPYKAHSAATMIALGADEIVMSDLSEISPIDPSTANLFNPPEPNNPQNRIPISVEDVIAYFDLAKNKFGIKNNEDLTKIFIQFIEANPGIHPLALGNVNRIHNLIRFIARRLLKSHNKPMKDYEMEKIIEYFTEMLYSHSYVIGRREAREELGVKTVVDAPTSLAKAMHELYEVYREEVGLGTIWNPELELGQIDHAKRSYPVAIIENANSAICYEVGIDFRRQRFPVQQGSEQVPQEQVTFRVVEQTWK